MGGDAQLPVGIHVLVMHNPKEPLLLPSTSFVVFIRSLSKKASTAAATSSLSAFDVVGHVL